MVPGKVGILLFAFIWLRGSLPRIRYDQLMAFGWKVLIPGALAWTLLIAALRVYRQHGGGAVVYIVGGGVIAVVLIWLFSVDIAAERRADSAGRRRGRTRRAKSANPSRSRRWTYRITTASWSRAPILGSAAADQELTPASVTEVTGA